MEDGLVDKRPSTGGAAVEAPPSLEDGYVWLMWRDGWSKQLRNRAATLRGLLETGLHPPANAGRWSDPPWIASAGRVMLANRGLLAILAANTASRI